MIIHHTHDLWNRLVKVTYEPDEDDPVDRAVYRYNGLNWRIDYNGMARADEA